MLCDKLAIIGFGDAKTDLQGLKKKETGIILDIKR
jgi:hypothetical protein